MGLVKKQNKTSSLAQSFALKGPMCKILAAGAVEHADCDKCKAAIGLASVWKAEGVRRQPFSFQSGIIYVIYKFGFHAADLKRKKRKKKVTAAIVKGHLLCVKETHTHVLRKHKQNN